MALTDSRRLNSSVEYLHVWSVPRGYRLTKVMEVKLWAECKNNELKRRCSKTLGVGTTASVIPMSCQCMIGFRATADVWHIPLQRTVDFEMSNSAQCFQRSSDESVADNGDTNTPVMMNGKME